MSRVLILLGALLLITGVVLHFAPGMLNWFGKLPGDIRINSGHGKVFIPITSMLIVSLLLTVLFNIFKQ